jgi:hypothetical protein
MKGSAGSAWPTSRAEDSESSGMRHSRGVADTLTAAVSIWPTPMAGTPAQNGNSAAGNSDFSRRAEMLADRLWTTPQAHDVTPRGQGQQPTAKAGNACLATDATVFDQWVTPQARDFRSPDSPDSPRAVRKAAQGWSQNLNDQTGQWPTPASRDYKGENGEAHLTNGTGRLHMDQLPNAVAHGFTHPAPATGTHGPLSFPQMRLALLLLRDVTSKMPRSVSRPYSTPSRRKPSSIARDRWRSETSWQRWNAKRAAWWTKKRLSPGFVSWLMGWPTGHALSNCSETAFSLWLQDMRFALSQLPTALGQWIWEPPSARQEAKQMDLW